MRVVIIGATGNVGTAMLERLHAAADVTELVGIATRTPDDRVEPYAGVEWQAIDIASHDAVKRLAAVFEGADAVIHLAWALQPNRDERAMWRTNVHGTANVLRAAAASRLRHLLVASSVGAYSLGPKHGRVDESWPTGGIATSHYGRHKAINERALDAFERAHPDVLVTRMRPGLIFQSRAGAEIAGLFLGRWFPTAWIRAVKLPILPLPTLTIFQAVHAKDVADAFWRAIDRRAGGPFNIAAEPVLEPQTIARVLGALWPVPFRWRAARLLVWVTWKLRLQATDPGWIDLAVSVPIMSTQRAREELGWLPTISSGEAFEEIVGAVSLKANYPASGPLHG